jgi:hypothetical protein
MLIAAGFTACGMPEKNESIATVQSALYDPAWYGYSKFFSLTGLDCYSKGITVPKTSTFYLCVVDLTKAYIKTMHGSHYSPRPGVEDKDTFWKKSANDLWIQGYYPPVVINASFFGTDYNPTNLSFPYKRDGNIVTYGTDCDAPPHRGNVRILQVWSDRQSADISSYNCSAVDKATLTSFGSAPEILGTLTNDVDKGRGVWKGRTFVGVADGGRTVLIFGSQKVDQDIAQQELANFGTGKIVMFDGGGSTQMMINGTLVVPSSDGRNIPNALVVYAW